MSAHIHTYTYTHTKCTYERTHACLERRRGSERAGTVADAGSFARLFRSTQSNHISHLQCKDLRDNVVYWKTKRKIKNDLQCKDFIVPNS